MQFRIVSLILITACLTLAAVPAVADNILYANGPSNGICDIQQCTVNAWAINFGFSLADSFQVQTDSTMHGMNFAVWMSPGDTMTSVDWAVGTCALCSDIASGTASGANLSETFISTNQFNYDIWTVGVTGLNVPVSGGITYWLTLQNAMLNNDDPVYWDENNGPSMADNGSIGSLPSESFNILGSSGNGTVPEPGSLLLFCSSIVGVAGVLRRKALR